MANKVAPESFDFPEIADTANPPAGYMRVYANTGALMQRDSAGTKTALGGTSLPAIDTTALVKGSADATKLVRFEVDGLTTGTTRVMTVPDADLTLVGTDTTQNLSNKTFTDGTMIDGSADEIQLRVQAHSTQTGNVLTLEDSAGNVQVSVDKDGFVVINEEGNVLGGLRVESDLEANALRVDGSVGEVMINGSTTDSTLWFDVIQNASTPRAARPIPTASAANITTIGVGGGNGSTVYDSTNRHHLVLDSGLGAWYGIGAYTQDGLRLYDPTDKTWTALNQGTGTYTVDTTNRRMVIVEDGDGTNDLRGWYMTAPSAPYEIRLYVKYTLTDAVSNGIAIGWRDNATAELATLDIFAGSVDTPALRVAKWTNPTTFSANYVAGTLISTTPHWIKLKDDNVNRSIHISDDGIGWSQLHSVARMDFLTPDRIFFGVFLTTAATFDTQASLLSFEQL